MDDLNYIIEKAKEQIGKLEQDGKIELHRAILEHLRVIRDAVYTKSQIGIAT